MLALRKLPFAAAIAVVSISGATACGSSDDTATGVDGGVEGGTGTPDGTSPIDAHLPDGGPAPDASGTDGADGTDTGTPASPSDVLEYHKHASRDGVYVDAKMTKAAAGALHRDTSFSAKVDGWIYAQPLYVAEGPNGKAALYVTTETNNVYALDAATGSVIWQKTFDMPSPLSALGCGNINPIGITGTPVIDLASRTMFFDAMTEGPKHLLYAISIDDGSARTGWPLDTTMIAMTTEAGNLTLDAKVQNERGALALFNGSIYVPYGGHIGDCGNYHGVVIGVPIGDPASAKAWATDSVRSGIWAAGGIASDGASLLVTTGNGNATTGGAWKGSEGVIRLSPGPTFSKATADYFVPSDWVSLDASDTDISGTGPIPFDLPGSTPSALVAAFGKNGVLYLVDRTNFGGIGKGNGTTGEALVSKKVTSGSIINASALYTTAQGTYAVFRGKGVGCPTGQGGDLTAVKITAGSPPTLAVAWCATQNGSGSPMVTVSNDQGGDAVVWIVGAEGSNQLQGFDGDTGAVVRAALDTGGTVRHFETTIDVDGRIFVGTDGELVAFTSQ